MVRLDKDQASVEEVKDLIIKTKKAQKELAKKSQEEIDRIVKAIADAGESHSELLAKMAVEETGFGLYEDKIVKNKFASQVLYESVKDMKTVGVLSENFLRKTMDIAVPAGVVAGLIPSTNPTSTVLYKAIISLKAGNGIVFSPHPSALGCIGETIDIITKAAERAGAPKNIITCMTTPTLAATEELMKNDGTSLILATGGGAMVKAAYSSGTPAIGVGPGNGPAYIEESADVSLAIKRILDSKTFDNGTICSSEQSIVVERHMEDRVIKELEAQGAYILTTMEAGKLGRFILRENGTMNPAIVGKSVEHIAELAELDIPRGTRVLVAKENRIGMDKPYSREKLGPILSLYTVSNKDEALDTAEALLLNEGAGHTAIIHSENEDIIREYSLRMPVSRLVVNSPSALGGIGGSTGLFPSLTLGCGTLGGSSVSDNVSPMNLLNIKKVAYGMKEIEDIRGEKPSNYDMVRQGSKNSRTCRGLTLGNTINETEDNRFSENTSRPVRNDNPLRGLSLTNGNGETDNRFQKSQSDTRFSQQSSGKDNRFTLSNNSAKESNVSRFTLGNNTSVNKKSSGNSSEITEERVEELLKEVLAQIN